MITPNAMQPSAQPSWDDIEPIWTKWTHLVIPSQVQRACENASEPFVKLLTRLNNMNETAGTVTTAVSDSYSRGAELGHATASSMRASFMVGLEFAEQGWSSQSSQRPGPRIADKALPFLNAALEPVSRAAVILIGRLAQARHISEAEMNSLADELGRVSLRCAADCFRIGLDYPVHHNDPWLPETSPTHGPPNEPPSPGNPASLMERAYSASSADEQARLFAHVKHACPGGEQAFHDRVLAMLHAIRQSDDPSTRRAALDGITALGEPALSDLLPVLHGPDTSLARAARVAMETIRVSSPLSPEEFTHLVYAIQAQQLS